MNNGRKNFKLVQNLKSIISPKMRWLSHANSSELDRSTTAYLEEISGVMDLANNSELKELETMVRTQLREEFPNIESMKSYEQIVKAVMNNLQSKNINCLSDLDG